MCFKADPCYIPIISFKTNLALLNFIVKKKSVSPVLKEELLPQIYKKGDKSDPSNYRGITVTPVFSKTAGTYFE